MGRNPIHKRLKTLQRFVGLNLCGIIIGILTVSSGCSKLGSQRGLAHTRFPLASNGSQSGTDTPLQRAARNQQLRRSQEGKRTPSNPVREEVNRLQTVKSVTSRPPKLSSLPKTTLFAQPVVSNASQVSFEQEVTPSNEEPAKPDQSAFDPTAEPPAQIFAQPVQTATADDGPAARVANSRTLSPMLFNPKTREVNSSFEGSLRGRQVKASEAPPILNATSPAQPKETLEPLIVVDEKSEAPEPAKLAEVSPFPILPEMLPLESTSPEPVVSTDAFKPQNISPPAEPISISQSTQAPIVDAAMGDHFDDSQSQKTTGVVESDVQLANDSQDSSMKHGIKIDANFAADFEAFPKEAEQTIQQPTVESIERPAPIEVASLPRLPKVQALPVLDPPAQDLLIQSISEEGKSQVAESDFEPLPEQAKVCTDCDQDNCLGCESPETAMFAEHVPNFDPGRNIVPMPVDIASLDSAELIKKNFSNVEFSPTDLPLPQDVDASSNTTENQFLAARLDVQTVQEPTIKTDVPPVGVEALMKLNAVTWQSRLAQTVDLVQEQLKLQNIDSDTRTSLEVNLRLLDVLSRQMGDLVDSQQQFSASENQYWQDQLEAITSMLKVADPVDGRANELLRHHTAHETLTHLRNAVAHLESLANLRVVAGEFCTEVSGYGQFNPFAYSVFPVGQKVLVYCEVENFNSTPQDSETGVSYLTRLRGSYAIYNSSGHAVQQAEFPTLEDVARKRRRDFYMHLPITIGNLDAGKYELHLLIEDLGGNKTASLTPPLLFTVEGQQEQPVARQARR